MENLDLSNFGYRELGMLAELLDKYSDRPTSEKYGNFDKLTTAGFNPNSGCVWLQDEDYHCLMLNGDTLEEFVSCSYCGAEGFTTEIEIDEDGNCSDCKGR